jgi:hypothetical protein
LLERRVPLAFEAETFIHLQPEAVAGEHHAARIHPLREFPLRFLGSEAGPEESGSICEAVEAQAVSCPDVCKQAPPPRKLVTGSTRMASPGFRALIVGSYTHLRLLHYGQGFATEVTEGTERDNKRETCREILIFLVLFFIPSSAVLLSILSALCVLCGSVLAFSLWGFGALCGSGFGFS